MSPEARKKGGRKPLALGKPRLLGYQGGVDGRAYHRAYAALDQEFLLMTPLLRLEAGRVAVAWVNFVAATRALTAARREREHGKGRRPSAQVIERLSRRQGLADASYSLALGKLRELAPVRQATPDLQSYLAARYPAGDGQDPVPQQEAGGRVSPSEVRP
jgi:hypothetical protein